MASTVEGDVWFYYPNQPAAIVFTISFGLIAGAIIYRSIQTKQIRAFFWVVMVGMIFEVIGFALRAAAKTDLSQVGFFAGQQSLIVLAPLFIAAGNYLVSSRMICSASPNRSKERVLYIPARWITKIFVACDIVTILIQVAGTTIGAGSDWVGETADIGSYVLMGGLAIQTLTLALFVAILLQFAGSDVISLRRCRMLGLRATFISSIFIELRCVYRLIEHATGYDGYLFTHEWNFYVFEALPMIIAMTVVAVWYPPRYIPTKTEQDTVYMAVVGNDSRGEA